MVIKGTEKIRGVLQMPQLKRELGRGKSMHLSEKEFNSSDVQIALRMGLIKLTEDSINIEKKTEIYNDDDRKITCKNIYPRPINFPNINKEIKPNQTFIVKESDLNTSYMKAAVEKNMIEILHANEKLEVSEGNLNIIGKLIKNKENSSSDEKLETNEDASMPKIVNENDDNDSEILEQTKNLSTENVASTNIIDDPNPAPIDPLEGKSKSTVANPFGYPVIKEASTKWINNTNAIDDPNPAPIDPLEEKSKAKVVNPFGYPVIKEASTKWMNNASKIKDKLAENVDEISFVDKQEEQERIENHPVLKEVKKTEDVSFVDLDKEQKDRARKHPKLRKKDSIKELE